MPYYRGDYVGQARGGYYKGDPFIGGLIARGVKAVAGPLVRKAGRWLGRQTVGGAIAKGAGAVATAGTVVGVGRSIARSQPIVIDPGAAMPGGEPLFGFGGRKKYRRMNPLNPRALKRALRRAEGFEKFARKTVNALRAGPKKFKTTRRKG